MKIERLEHSSDGKIGFRKDRSDCFVITDSGERFGPYCIFGIA